MKKKRILIILLAMILAFAIAGCNGKNKADKKDTEVSGNVSENEYVTENESVLENETVTENENVTEETQKTDNKKITQLQTPKQTKIILLPIRTNQHQTKMKQRQSQAQGLRQSQTQALLVIQGLQIAVQQVTHKIITQTQQHSHLFQYMNINGQR